MYKFSLRVSTTLLVCFCVFAVSNALGNGSGGRGRSGFKSDSQKPIYNGLGYANGDHNMKLASSEKQLVTKPRGGIGLSAWGIIAVLGGSMLFGTVFYYAVLFYPILCKKERKNQNERRLDCCPSAPPPLDQNPALSTPV